MDDARFLSELRRSWDETPEGGPARPNDLDPELAALIRYLHALRDVPPPDPIFARQLQESLMSATTMPLPLADSATMPGGNGRWVAPIHRPTRPPLPTAQPRWAPAQLATALLVMLVLIGSVLTFGFRRFGQPEEQRLVVPAISGTPAPSEPMVTETLFDATVDDLPTGRGDAALIQWTMEAGPQALVVLPQEGPRFFILEAGELTATEAGSEQRLAAGDVYIAATTDQEVALRVSGSEDASLIRGYVATSWRSASWDSQRHRYKWLLESFPNALPGGSGHLVVQRLTLPPGSALSDEAREPLTWFGFAEGTVGLTLEGTELPPGWATGEEETFVAGGSLPTILAGTRMTLRNAGDDPLVLYRMTLTPDDAAASGTGTPVP